jgi:hypothetical protein
MTAAERKARSRALQAEAVEKHLERANRLASEWIACIKAGRGAATDTDIAAGFDEIRDELAEALLKLPRA